MYLIGSSIIYSLSIGIYGDRIITQGVRRRAGLRGGQIGQLPGAPNFGGPMNYLINFFFTIYMKKKTS